MGRLASPRRIRRSFRPSPDDALDTMLQTLEVPPRLEKRARELLQPLSYKNEFLKGAEVDELMRFSRRTRQRLVQAGFLPEWRAGGGTARYLRLDVARLVLRGAELVE